MKVISILFFFTLSLGLRAQTFNTEEIKSLKKEAKKVTIIKDKWGVPHVYAKTDAGAVFGMAYVQCEEFFDKVEETFISRLGRQAEVDGERAVYKDLWSRIFTDSLRAKAQFKESPEWLQKLCAAFAGGINFYLISHPAVKPKLIKR